MGELADAGAEGGQPLAGNVGSLSKHQLRHIVHPLPMKAQHVGDVRAGEEKLEVDAEELGQLVKDRTVLVFCQRPHCGDEAGDAGCGSERD